MTAINTLLDAKIFSVLAESDLTKIAEISTGVRYGLNQLVIAAGSSPCTIAVLLEGGLHIVDAVEEGRLCHVGMLQPGESLNWITAIDGLPIHSHVIAATANTHVLHIPFAAIHALLAQRPAFNKAVMMTLASTIRHYIRTRAALSAPSVAQRIYRVLFGLAQDAAAQPKVVLPKQHDLASLANTSRETVSRTLQELIKSGVLEKNGHQISVKDFSALQQLASGSKT